jgi:hypothetical protein
MPPEPVTSELLSACQLLFGRKATFSPSFLSRLGPDSLKSTYREKALSTHPDRAAALGKDPVRLEKEFRRVVAAFKVLDAHVRSRPAARTASSRPGPRRAPASAAPPSRRTAGRPAARPDARAGKTRENPARSASGRAVTRFWRGPLPRRQLKFGQFLFFSGVIPARDLLDAIHWQRRQRPAFGQIARDWGILTPQQVAHVLARKLPAETFGACAARLGYMTPFEAHAVAVKQKKLQRPFGHFFLEQGVLDQRSMAQALLLHHAHNTRFLR